jgi:ribosome-binding factor A
MARVRSLLIRTISEIIREELSDPRIGIFSLTDLTLSRDLGYADIKVSAVGGEEATAECVKALNGAAPIIWNRLRSETDLRAVPKLRFHVDNSGEYLDDIERLLRQINNEDSTESRAGDTGEPADGKDT